jgi:hypothetical protein
MIKYSQNEKPTKDDLILMKELQNQMKFLIDGGFINKYKKLDS